MPRWMYTPWIRWTVALTLLSPAALVAQENRLNISVRSVYLDEPAKLGQTPVVTAGHLSTLICRFDIEGHGFSGPGWKYESAQGQGLIHILSPWKLALLVDGQVVHLGDGPQWVDSWRPYGSTQPVFWTTKLTNHIDYRVEADWLPTEPGNHELRCSLDVGHVVPESNESDNVTTIPFSVIGTLTRAPDPNPRAAAPGLIPPPSESKETPSAVRSPGLRGRVAEPEKLPLSEAKLVTTSASVQPAQPMAGQSIAVQASVQNQGGLPSQAGLGFLVVCDETPGGPACPKKTPFSAIMQSIAPGSTTPVVVALDVPWAPGKYRLVAGTDVIFLNDALDVELVVTSSPYGAVPMERGEAQRQDELGGVSRELNPQPEPPSAEAAPAMPAPPAAAAVPRVDPAPAPTRVEANRMAPAQVFSMPMWDGKRVDLCLVWGGQCGAPAATEFCKRSGYTKVTAWQPANDIGAATPTVVLSSGQVCSDASCDGFASITCAK